MFEIFWWDSNLFVFNNNLIIQWAFYYTDPSWLQDTLFVVAFNQTCFAVVCNTGTPYDTANYNYQNFTEIKSVTKTSFKAGSSAYSSGWYIAIGI